MASLPIIRGACPHDCPDTCSWDVTVSEGRAVTLRGAHDHPLTQGRLCAKVNRFLDRVYSPDRLLYPLRRVGPKGEARFVRCSWQSALDEISDRIGLVVREHGSEAVMPYSYLGTQGVIQGGCVADRFFAALGATRLHRAICGGGPFAGYVAAQGSTKGMLPEDLRHSQLIVLWGTNTIVTNLHLWPFISEARAHGARLVVIDPVKTRTAQQADEHIPIRPGSDAAFALGLMHVIVSEDLADNDYVDAHTTGMTTLRETVAAYPPSRVAAITGVAEDVITSLARTYATTRPAAIRTLVGIGHHQHAAKTIHTIACLPALVGAWRDLGGGIVGTTAWAAWGPLNLAAAARSDLDNPSRRTVNMVELGAALTQLEPPVRTLIVYNSNPATIAPQQARIQDGLRRDDLFTVVIEQFMTDTAAYADLVLPATTQLEHLDLMPSWGSVYVSLNLPAIDPVGEALPNSEIFRLIGRRLGLDPALFADDDESLVRLALESDHPLLEGVTFERLRRDGYARVGVSDDWRPYANGGFGTPDGRFVLDPPGFVDAAESPTGDHLLAERYPLQLVTGKWSLHFLNSSYANLPRHAASEGEMPVDVATDDAATRGITDGALVRIRNDRGAVLAVARVGDRVRPGVVALPSGWWASRSRGGASANSLTSDRLTDAGGGATFHDTLVEIEPVSDTG
jgi:anaerobic selenocysteine-containing dehydrogenase